MEDCAKWLQNMPIDSAVLPHYFTAMDQFSKEDDAVLTCRIWNNNGEVKVDYYPLAAADKSMYMITTRDSRFDEGGYHYQRRVQCSGKPDRSQGTPFS